MELRAVGDFPPGEGTVEVGTPTAALARLERVPPSTRMLTVQARVQAAEWVAAGVRRVQDLPALQSSGGDTRPHEPVLLLPLGRSCALGDPELTAPPGSALAALPSGSVAVFGGREGEAATRRAVLLRAGHQLSERIASGLSLRRAGATATVTDGQVVIAGGGPGNGVAHDTFELMSPGGGRIELPEGRRLTAPRRDHGAVRLPDGRVLLVGGRTESDGPALGTAEIVDPGDGATAVEGGLDIARVRPHVVRLDDGTVLVIGGIGPGGGTTPILEAFDPAAGAFVRLEQPRVPAFDRGVAVALPGARLLWLGVDDPQQPSEPGAVLLRREPPYLPGTFELESIPLPLELPELTSLRATALGNGHVLLTGRGQGAMPRAFVVDPGTGQVRPAEASRVPRRLIRLAGGTVVELDGGGASLRRELIRTPYDSPPTLPQFGVGGDGIALDAPGRWERTPGALVAKVDGARFDVPLLRFGDFEVARFEIADADGEAPEAELLLRPEDARPVPIRVLANEVSTGLCTAERAEGAPLELRREQNGLVLEAGADPKRCTVPRLDGPVGLAVRAEQGTGVRTLRVQRLAADDQAR